MADFHLTSHGSVVTLRPQTEAAHEWCVEHIPIDAIWFGGELAIEPRYVDPIIDGIIDDGLEIE